MIRNVHERNLRANINDVAALLYCLASENDRLWPKDRWPAMKLSNGLVQGSVGGHGFVRYSVANVDQHGVVFRFDERIGLRGTHRFELEETAGGGCVIRHVLEGESLGLMRIGWPLVVRSLHDALVEDGLDNAVRELDGEPVKKRSMTSRVRLLRRGLSFLRQQPALTSSAQRAASDVVALALAETSSPSPPNTASPLVHRTPRKPWKPTITKRLATRCRPSESDTNEVG